MIAWVCFHPQQIQRIQHNIKFNIKSTENKETRPVAWHYTVIFGLSADRGRYCIAKIAILSRFNKSELRCLRFYLNIKKGTLVIKIYPIFYS